MSFSGGWIAARKEFLLFAFLNYFDAHDPYQPPAPYDTWFDSTGRAGILADGAGRHTGAIGLRWR